MLSWYSDPPLLRGVFMSISDPAQLLQRIPELGAFTDDPRIRRAIESGDPFKVFRALMLARLLRRLPAHKKLLKELTGQRRLFAKALKGNPSLGSINSVGFGFIGKAEQESDGSHIALHAFVPLGAYVVRSTGNRSWQIYARAPLGIPGWLYTRGLAAAMVLMVGSGAIHSFHAASHQDLTVLNGFDEPLTLAFDGQTLILPAQGRLGVTLKAGKLRGTASSARNGVIDTIDAELASSDRLSIWNVAGAAPLVRNTVLYTKEASTGPAPANAQTVYCGKRFVELSNVRYRFEPPPQSIKMGKHDTSTSVEQADVATRPNTAGAAMCAAYLIDHAMGAEGAMLMAAQAQLKNWDEDFTAAAVFAAQAVSRPDAIAMARRAVRDRPDSLRLARILQNLRQDAGEFDVMLAEHRERARAHPGSEREQYLYASLLSGQAGIDMMQELSARFPQQPSILRSLAWRKANHGDPRGALHDIARLHALSPVDAARLMGVEARALLAMRRGGEAIQLLEAGAQANNPAERTEHAMEYALIARQLRTDPERFLIKPAQESGPLDLDFHRVCVGLAPLDAASAESPLVKLALALRDAPGAAMAIAGKLGRHQIMAFPDGERALIYGEAVRTGQAGLIATMHGLLLLPGPEENLFQQYLRGESVSLDSIDLEQDVRAAAMFIRSRNAQLPASERAALRDQAGKADLLHGAVSTALNQWKG
jgi:hypothetical protein